MCTTIIYVTVHMNTLTSMDLFDREENKSQRTMHTFIGYFSNKYVGIKYSFVCGSVCRYLKLCARLFDRQILI